MLFIGDTKPTSLIIKCCRMDLNLHIPSGNLEIIFEVIPESLVGNNFFTVFGISAFVKIVGKGF